MIPTPRHEPITCGVFSQHESPPASPCCLLAALHGQLKHRLCVQLAHHVLRQLAVDARRVPHRGVDVADVEHEGAAAAGGHGGAAAGGLIEADGGDDDDPESGGRRKRGGEAMEGEGGGKRSWGSILLLSFSLTHTPPRF
jgi:hypothetical protein